MANFDYTKYDYDALVEHITKIVSDTDEWNDAYQSSTGQVLIQMLAAMTDQLHYMLERRTQEAYLPTAKLESSVGAISNLLGYVPRRAVSSAGELDLNLIDGNGTAIAPDGNVFIPKYSTITLDDKLFTNTSDIFVSPTDLPPKTFTIKEGEVKEIVIDTNDTTTDLYKNNYVLIEDYRNIEENSFWIYTDTQDFTYVKDEVEGNIALESLAFATNVDQVYDIRVTSNGLQIIFGDGFNGEKPTGTLRIKYIESSGPDVTIASTGLDFAFLNYSTITDSKNNTYDFTLKNSTSIDGGLDPESIDQTKLKAPDYIRTNARAVTNHDYVYWTKRFGSGGIVDVSAYGEQEKGVDVINANNVFITYLLSDGTDLTATELQSLNDYLDVYKTITTHLVINSADQIPLQINVRLSPSKYLSASHSEVYDHVKDGISSYLEFQEGSLGADVFHSSLTNYLSNLELTKDGITRDVAEYVSVDIRALKPFDVPFETTSDHTATITYGSDGDTYTISLSGTDYSYTTSAGDVADDVATILAGRMNFDDYITASSSTNTIDFGLESATRDNQVLYSEQFDNAYWTKNNATVTPDDIVAPNGQTVADKLVDDATDGKHGLILNSLNSGSKTFVIRATAAELDHLNMYFYNVTDGTRGDTVFDLTNGTVVSGTGTITALNEPGWYECSITDNTSTVSDGVRVFTHNGTTNSYVGTGQGIHIYGAQLNYADTATKYLKTTDTTRTIDSSTNVSAYTVSIVGTTTEANLSIPVTIQVPESILNNEDLEQLFLPNYIEIISSDGTVLDTDDGAGNILGGTFDYVTGELTIPLIQSEDTYYVRYLQNIDKNFYASQKQVFTYSLPKTNYTDTTELLSTIEVI